jgi:hypothetical protein
MSRVKRDEPVRAARVPVSSSRAPLEVKGFDHKNFYGRWVADIDERIQTFLDGGYEFTKKSDIHKAGERTVDSSSGLDSRVSKPGGRGATLYLMQLPRKFYEEDRKAKDAAIDQTEEGLKKTSKSGADYGKLKIGSDFSEQ